MITNHMMSLLAKVTVVSSTSPSNMNLRLNPRKNEYRMLVLPFFLLLPFSVTVSLYVSTINIANDRPTNFEDKIPSSHQNYGRRYYFSLMPTDRSGGSIREILLAHAYTYQQNQKLQQLLLDEAQSDASINQLSSTENFIVQENHSKQQNPSNSEPLIQYGGVCPYSWMPLQHFRTQTKEAMIEKLHLGRVLPVACPSWMWSSSSSASKVASASEKYRDYKVKRRTDTHPSELLLDDKLYRYNDADLITKEWRQYLHEQRILFKKTDKIGQQSANDSNNPNNEFKIVVHVRRGDVNPCRYPERYLPNDHYMRLIQEYWPSEEQLFSFNHTNWSEDEMLTLTSRKTVRVIIYSESESYESFDVFFKNNYTVLLDTSDLSEIWNEIIDSDIFIMSRSSFSHVPAILNMKGRIIFTPFWEQPLLDDWVVVSPELMNQTEAEIAQLRTEACKYRKYRWKSSSVMKYLDENFDLLINPKPSRNLLRVKEF